MLKERCMYCGKIFTDEEKAANKVTTITKPALQVGQQGGSKIVQKPTGYHCTKKCFMGSPRQMYSSWIEADLRNGVWIPVVHPKGSGLTLRKF